jgi:hypothetical protein
MAKWQFARANASLKRINIYLFRERCNPQCQGTRFETKMISSGVD